MPSRPRGKRDDLRLRWRALVRSPAYTTSPWRLGACPSARRIGEAWRISGALVTEKQPENCGRLRAISKLARPPNTTRFGAASGRKSEPEPRRGVHRRPGSSQRWLSSETPTTAPSAASRHLGCKSTARTTMTRSRSMRSVPRATWHSTGVSDRRQHGKCSSLPTRGRTLGSPS